MVNEKDMVILRDTTERNSYLMCKTAINDASSKGEYVCSVERKTLLDERVLQDLLDEGFEIHISNHTMPLYTYTFNWSRTSLPGFLMYDSFSCPKGEVVTMERLKEILGDF